jgi:glycerophosphoryl diester phosphodiesterase
VIWARRGPHVVGHRGGRGEGWPAENTIAAFDRARAEGAVAIELDVRTCMGGEVVVFHDADLARLTGGDDRRAVAKVTSGELAHVRLGAGGDRAPTLDDALAWADAAGLAVNVELKRDVPDRVALARAVARVIARHARARVLVSSFDPALLAGSALLAPRVPRAWLTHEGQRWWEPAWAALAARAPIHAVHLERTQASSRLVARLRAAGKRVGVWTVNDPAEAKDLVAAGVDWIITDAPARIGAALRAPA